MKNTTFSVATTAALVLALGACGSESTDSGSGGEGDSGESAAADLDLISEGTLTVCSEVPYEPFEMEDSSTESGYSGFDIDLMQAIADGLELELEVKDSSFDALESGLALNSGDCDVAASAMTITEDRQENLAFSEGYYDSQQSLLVPEGSDIASIEDLAGARVAVQQSTTGEAYAQENATDADISSFPGNPEMFQAIQAGQVDAILQDLPVNVENARQGGFEIVEEYSTDEQYGFAMQKDNTALVDAVNGQLTEMRDSGEYDEIYNTYFSTEGGDEDSATSEG